MSRHFIVTGNVIVPPKRGFTARFAVVCKDIERAIALAKEHYPEMVVMSVADQGAIDKVDA